MLTVCQAPTYRRTSRSWGTAWWTTRNHSRTDSTLRS